MFERQYKRVAVAFRQMEGLPVRWVNVTRHGQKTRADSVKTCKRGKAEKSRSIAAVTFVEVSSVIPISRKVVALLRFKP